MVLHAIEDVDDAFAATRALLWPVDRATWLKLALVAFFLGSPGGGLNTIQYNVGGDGGNGGLPPGGLPIASETVLLVALAVVLVALVLGLAFSFVGAVMEFVFLESLREQEVRIRAYWDRHWRRGARLFGFRLAVGAFVLGGILLVSALFVLPLVGIGRTVAAPAALAVVLLLPVFVVLGLAAGLVNGFTTSFVVPIMLLEDCGVLAGWRRLWSSVVDQWRQYLTYALVSVLLSTGGGILVGVVTGVAALVLLVPFGGLFLGGVALQGSVEVLGIALMVVAGVLFALAMLVVVAVVQVPVLAYLRYYALLVLGDVEEDLDLIPEQRAAVRE